MSRWHAHLMPLVGLDGDGWATFDLSLLRKEVASLLGQRILSRATRQKTLLCVSVVDSINRGFSEDQLWSEVRCWWSSDECSDCRSYIRESPLPYEFLRGRFVDLVSLCWRDENTSELCARLDVFRVETIEIDAFSPSSNSPPAYNTSAFCRQT